MNPTHILLIEDDVKIVNFMSMAFKAKGYRLSVAYTGNSGILSFCTEKPDLILLDLGLPDKDGIEIIKEIRNVSQIPILKWSELRLKEMSFFLLRASLSAAFSSSCGF